MNYFMTTSSPKKAIDLSEFQKTLRTTTFTPDPNEEEPNNKSITHQQFTFTLPLKFKSSINRAVQFVESYYNVKTKNKNVVNITNAPLFGFSAVTVSDQPSVKNRWTKMTADQFYQLDEKLKDSVETFQEAHKKIKLDELAENPKFKGNIQKIKNELSKYSKIKKNVSSNLRQEESIQSSMYEVGDLEDLGLANNSQLDQTEELKLTASKILSNNTSKAPQTQTQNFGGRINFVINTDKQSSAKNINIKKNCSEQKSISSQESQSPKPVKTTQKEVHFHRDLETEKKQISPKRERKESASSLASASQPSNKGSSQNLSQNKIERDELSMLQVDQSNLTSSSKQRKASSPSSQMEPSEAEKSHSHSHKHSYEEEKPSEFKLMFFQPGSREKSLRHDDKTLSRNDIREKSESDKDGSVRHSLKDVTEQSFTRKPILEESRSVREKSPESQKKTSPGLSNYLKNEAKRDISSTTKDMSTKRQTDYSANDDFSSSRIQTKSLLKNEKSPEPVNKLQESIFDLKTQLNKIASKEARDKSEKSEKSKVSSLKDSAIDEFSPRKSKEMVTSKKIDMQRSGSREPISQLKTEMNKIMIKTGEVQDTENKKENKKDPTPKPTKQKEKEKDFGLFFGSFEQIKSSQSGSVRSKQSIDHNNLDLSSSLMHKESSIYEKNVLQKKEGNRDEKRTEVSTKERTENLKAPGFKDLMNTSRNQEQKNISREEKSGDNVLIKEMRGKLQSLSDKMNNVFQEKSKSRERENNDSEEDYDFENYDNRDKNLRDFYTNSAYLNNRDNSSPKSRRTSDDKERQMEELGFFGMGSLKVSSKKLS